MTNEMESHKEKAGYYILDTCTRCGRCAQKCQLHALVNISDPEACAAAQCTGQRRFALFLCHHDAVVRHIYGYKVTVLPYRDRYPAVVRYLTYTVIDGVFKHRLDYYLAAGIS